MISDKLKYLAWKYPVLKVMLTPILGIRQAIRYKRRNKHEDVIQNLRDLLVCDPVIKVDEFKGKFMMNVNSSLFDRLIVEKKYEPEIALFCEKYVQHKRDVIDVGANIGFFTVLFAKTLKGAKVISVEPTKNALKYLYENLKLNEVMGSVEVFEGVASDVTGEMEIKTIGGKEEYSSIGLMKHPSIIDKEFLIQIVSSITIDRLVADKSLNPGFIKIDVEGAENLVLKGCKRVLKENRPIILSELSDYLLKANGSSSMEVIDLLKEFEYDVFDMEDPSSPVGWKGFGDIICFPREMGIKFAKNFRD